MERTIRCAHDFCNSTKEVSPLPASFDSVGEALRCLSNAVEFEGRAELSTPIEAPSASQHRIRAGVDFHTSKPGLWLNKGGLCLLDLEVAEPPPPARKRKFSAETEEARAQKQLQKLKEKRDASPKKRTRKQSSDCGDVDHPSEVLAETAAETAAAPPESPPLPPAIERALDAALSEVSGETARSHHATRLLTRWTAHWRAVAAARHPTSPRGGREPAPGKGAQVHDPCPATPQVRQAHALFPSPLNVVRTYEALQMVSLHPALRAPLLRARFEPDEAVVPTDGVFVVHGPPGTGKTGHTAEHLLRLLELPATGPKGLRRILVCSQSNEAVDNLFERFASARPAGRSKQPTVLRTTPTGRAQGEHLVPDGKKPADVRSRLVVFCTTSARNNGFFRDVSFDAVLVDEASLNTEFETWALLRGTTRHLYLVGDHEQLGPQTSQDGRRMGHHRSTMQRLVEADYPRYTLLAEQQRMTPSLGDMISRRYYAGRVRNGPHAPDPVVAAPFATVDVPGGTAERVGTSWVNPSEAEAALTAARELATELAGVLPAAPVVAVLSPYAAQHHEVQRRLGSDRGLVALTVDAAQGREYDGVVVTTVRVGPDCGFWKNSSRSLVALTRARHAVRLVGHRESWAGWGPLFRFDAACDEAP